MKACRGNRGVGLFILNFDIRWRRVLNFTPPAALPSRKNHVTHWIKGWVDPKARLDVFAEEKTSYPYRDRTSDFPARSLVAIPTTIIQLPSKFSILRCLYSFSSITVLFRFCAEVYPVCREMHCVYVNLRIIIALHSLNRASWYTYVRKTNKMHTFLNTLFQLDYPRHVSNR
jgi:hypothetical protein